MNESSTIIEHFGGFIVRHWDDLTESHYGELSSGLASQKDVKQPLSIRNPRALPLVFSKYTEFGKYLLFSVLKNCAIPDIFQGKRI